MHVGKRTAEMGGTGVGRGEIVRRRDRACGTLAICSQGSTVAVRMFAMRVFVGPIVMGVMSPKDLEEGENAIDSVASGDCSMCSIVALSWGREVVISGRENFFPRCICKPHCV